MLKCFSIILFFMLCLNIYAQTDSINFLKVGDKAPVFHVKSHNNETLDLT